MSAFDLTTIGEVMLRLSVPVGERLERARQLDVHPGGAEGNVAVALARIGRRTSWAGSLPENPLGRLIANQMCLAGVDLGGVIWSPTGRLGTYYLEFAAPPRSTQVVYDRADSCITRLAPAQVDWDRLLDTRLLHLTGITPALSSSCRQIVQEAIRRAHAAGIPVTFDVNYRSKLWSEAEAAAVLTPLIQDTEILFCGRADAGKLFGCQGEPQEIVARLAELSQARCVVVSLAEAGVMAWCNGQILQEAALPVQIIDRPGAGDGLAAGILHGWLDGDLAKGLRYGTVLAALALSQHGDMIVTTPAEVESLLSHDGSSLSR